MEINPSKRNLKPTVTFHGATQTVTGSMHLVEASSRKILLDCGLYFGHNWELRQRNRRFPFDPAEIDAVLISHAHVDHCGNLPNLVRQGFSGPIYCTPATHDLLSVMLADSAKIQEEDAQVAPPNGGNPLYSIFDVKQTLKQCVEFDYNQVCEIGNGVLFQFKDAGHILGSAMIFLRVPSGVREYSITYTGDLGRRELSFLRKPSPVPAADLLISECTYGGRGHQPLEELAGTLSQVIDRTFNRDGKVLIPAFSLGRAQIVVHYLQKWIHEGLIPNVPIHVDSPLVADIVAVYRRHPELLVENSQAILEPEGNGSSVVKYVRTWAESRELGSSKESAIVVASGGMLDAGRALYHLQQNVDDPRASIVLVSYQAPQSLGWRLLQRGPTVYFLGKNWNKWADVVGLNGFSGHADHNDFIRAFRPIAEQTRKVKLVHGELERAEALAEGMRREGFRKVSIPEQDQTFSVG